MGRQRTIDREKLLEAIFDIVMEQGAAALTIDTVAKKMGISKGGVQYCFSSKEAMIDDTGKVTMKRSLKRVLKTITRQKIVLLHIFMRPIIMTKSLLPKVRV